LIMISGSTVRPSSNPAADEPNLASTPTLHAEVVWMLKITIYILWKGRTITDPALFSFIGIVLLRSTS